METNSSPSQSFFPERISRRGEILAWVFALISIATWIILRANGQRLTTPAAILSLFLAFSAASISLGNWMDRRTVIRLASDSISFQNGLRNVRLTWDAIQSVRVFPGRFGAKQVQVLGEKAHFEFRTLGEVRYNDEIRGRTGFKDGEEILKSILDAAHLKMIQRPDSRPNVYYYARE